MSPSSSIYAPNTDPKAHLTPEQRARFARTNATCMVSPPPRPLGPLPNYQDPPVADTATVPGRAVLASFLPTPADEPTKENNVNSSSSSSLQSDPLPPPPPPLSPAICRLLISDLNAQAALEIRAYDNHSADVTPYIEFSSSDPNAKPPRIPTAREYLTSHRNRGERMRLARAVAYAAGELRRQEGFTHTVARLMQEANRLIARAPKPPRQRRMAVAKIVEHLRVFNADPMAFSTAELPRHSDRFATCIEELHLDPHDPDLTFANPALHAQRMDYAPPGPPMEKMEKIATPALDSAEAAPARSDGSEAPPPARSEVSSLHPSSFELQPSNLSGSVLAARADGIEETQLYTQHMKSPGAASHMKPVRIASAYTGAILLLLAVWILSFSGAPALPAISTVGGATRAPKGVHSLPSVAPCTGEEGGFFHSGWPGIRGFDFENLESLSLCGEIFPTEMDFSVAPWLCGEKFLAPPTASAVGPRQTGELHGQGCPCYGENRLRTSERFPVQSADASLCAGELCIGEPFSRLVRFAIDGLSGNQIMAFQGDLASFSLADVFQNLTQNKQSGTLQINVGAGAKERHLHFQKGNLLYLSFGPNTRVIYPEIFRSKGLLDAEAFDKALNHSRDTGKPFIDAILGLGLANPDQLAVVASHAIEESVYELFTWESGPFEFIEGAADISLYEDQVTLPLKGTPGASLIMEAARRIDEWDRLKAQVKSLQNIYIFESNLRAAAEQGEFGMQPHELAIMRVMDGSRDVDDLAEGTRLSHFVVVNALVGFLNTSMARLATVDELKNSILRLSVPGLEGRKIKVYERILLLGGEDLSIRQALAETCISAGNAERAIAHLQVLAQASEQANDKSEALRLYERILQIEPEHINAHRRCGELLATGGDSRRAAQHFSALYTKFENDGRYTEAAEACSKAVNAEPLNLQHRLQWVRCAMLADQRPDAMRELEYVGDQMSKQGRIRAAADIYKRLMVMEKSRPAIKAKLQNVLVSEDEKKARRRSRSRMMVAFAVLVVIAATLGWWEYFHNRAVVDELIAKSDKDLQDSKAAAEKLQLVLNKITKETDPTWDYKNFKTAEEGLLEVNKKAVLQAVDMERKAQTIASLVPDSLWNDHPKKKLVAKAVEWRFQITQNQDNLERSLRNYQEKLIESKLDSVDTAFLKIEASCRFSRVELAACKSDYSKILEIREKTQDPEHGYSVDQFYKTYAERKIKVIDERLKEIQDYLEKEQNWGTKTNWPPAELAEIYHERVAMMKRYPLEDEIKQKPLPVLFIPLRGQTGIWVVDKANDNSLGQIDAQGFTHWYSVLKPMTYVLKKQGYVTEEFSTKAQTIGPAGSTSTVYLFDTHDVKFDLKQEAKRVIITGVTPVAGAINPGNNDVIVIPDTSGAVVGVQIPAGRGTAVVPKFKIKDVAKPANNETILNLQSQGGGIVYALVAAGEQQPRVVSVNTAKGVIEWDGKPLGPFKVIPRLVLYTPPALQNKTVIAVGTDKRFFLINADGTPLQGKVDGVAPPMTGDMQVTWTTLPVVAGNFVYVGASDGSVYQYDLKVLEDPIRFSISNTGDSIADLTVVQSNNAQLVVITSSAVSKKAVLFDTSRQDGEKRGKEINSVEIGDLPITPLEQKGDFLFFGLSTGNLGKYQINTVAPQFVTVDLGNPVGHLTGPLLFDKDYIYLAIDNGAPKCYKLQPQQGDLEQKDVGNTEGKRTIGAPLLDAVNGKVYLLIRNSGEIYEMPRSGN